MHKAVSVSLAGMLLLAGCGHGSTMTGNTTTTGTGGGGGAGGGDGTACTTASISVEGDGPTNHFGAACLGTHGIGYTMLANGFLGYPGPQSGLAEELYIEGCAESSAPPADGSLLLRVPQTTVGTAMTGHASYANGTSTFTTDTDVTVMVTALTGRAIAGSYTATVSGTNGVMHAISGTFSVCRVPDLLPP